MARFLRNGLGIFVLVIVVLMRGVVPAQAQGLTGIQGIVTDASGAVIPGVEITVTDSSTRTSRTVLTNERGHYLVPQLQPGRYSIRAELPGFKVKAVSGLVLPVGETVTQNLQLEVGAVTDVVDVVASAEAVNTVDAKLGLNFDSKKIIDLPLNARNIVDLLGLQAGVTLNQDDGGQVNGARPDQQNIVLDGVNINRQENGAAMQGALPTTVDSVQEFIVQTAGADSSAGRGSGGQVQLVTRRGSNEIHGSLYEFYRTTGTSARNYFASEPQQLIRHIPGGSIGGPVVKDRLFFFATYERNTDRSTELVTRNVPTPEFLDGHVRYARKDGTFGEITDGCNGMLEKWTLIPCDTWNKNLFGSGGLFEKYRPYSTDALRTKAGNDGGANILEYRFNSPQFRNGNTYISRLDYTMSSAHTFYFRGTLNDDKRNQGSTPLLGIENPSNNLNNSKGFAANWNWVISPRVNNNLTGGLTRESFEITGQNTSIWTPNGFASTYSNTAANRQAINTWNLVDNFSWIQNTHNVQGGANFRYISNYVSSFQAVSLPTFSGAANLTGNDIGVASSPGLRRAVGDAEFARISSAQKVGDAVMAATGSVSQFAEDVQFDIKGNKLPAGQPFIRTFLLQEYEFYLQDTWKPKTNFSVVYGVNYSVQTPPYEKNGLQVNWTQDLQNRWKMQSDTLLTAKELPLYAAQPAGRVNGLRDYYPADTNNWAPRVSFAWTPDLGDSFLGRISHKGGQTVIRGGYNMLYDGFGRSFARQAATVGSIGLKTRFSIGSASYSIDGLNNVSRAPRIGPSGWIGSGLDTVRAAFPPSPNQVSFALPITTAGGWGAVSTDGVDSNLHAAASHMFTLTVSKELPRGWVVDASYVGRFSRDLMGVTDIASPVNLRDPKSGMTFYDAVKQLYEAYEFNSVPIADVQPIDWFENVYAASKPVIEKQLGKSFNSVTQAFYAILHKSRQPGPNTQASLTDTIHGNIEKVGGLSILTQPQVQFFGLYTNLSRSNYNSAQFVVRKRFADGFSLNLNYTLSKSFDITSAGESRGDRPGSASGEGLSMDSYHPERQYAYSDFDRRHQFNGNFLLELPFGHGRAFGPNVPKAVNAIIGGWDVSGITVVTSGRPFSFTANSRYNHHYFGRAIPRIVKPIDFHLTKTPEGQVFWIGDSNSERASVAADNFVNVYPGGPIARNQGRGPAFYNIDASLTKNLSITEATRARLRWEVFNVLNHPNFAMPAGTAVDIDQGIGLLGRITSTNGTERVMQFSFRFEW